MNYMKFNSIIVALSIAALTMQSCRQEDSTLEKAFANPSADQRVGCYWYWIDKTITKEGVIADLKAMKKAGITRAYIGLTGGGEDLAFMSDAWWDLIHTALKTATELDVEIGMFNCPGWSQSGGPWIKPSQSMRYLAAIERRVKGPAKFAEKIPVTENDIQNVDNLWWGNEAYQAKPEDFQDVKVLAFPVNTEREQNLFNASGAKITTSSNISIAPNKEYKLPKEGDAIIELKLPKPATTRGLTLNIAGPIISNIELQAKSDDTYRTIKTFSVDRTTPTLSRGFKPYSPAVITFPETTSDNYRLIFHNTRNEGNIASIVLNNAQTLERYPEKTLAKLYNGTPPWNAFMWEAQTADPSLSIKPADVLDISSFMTADGTLTWDVPEGDWVILRTGMLPTGLQNSPSPVGAAGPEVDKINGEHVIYHHEQYLGEILRRIPAEDRKTFRINVMDSYEKGSLNITDNFVDIFKTRYGYDPTPFFPAYYGYPIGSPELSDRFLWDMRRLVADRIAYEYIAVMREKSHADGLTTWLENYGDWGFSGEFLQYGGQSDEVGGEFWLGSYEDRAPDIRCATSCANTYGKTKVWAESFTGGGGHYTVSPGSIKHLGDWAFAQGVSACILHVYIQQQANNDYPGIDAWYNTQFNRKNTWFSQLDLFTDYIRRCGVMLQHGLNVADVAYFIGEDTPKQCGITDPPLPDGYHYDFINAEVILRDAFVQDGKITLPHGTQYHVLVLPPQETMRPEVLHKILQLANDGAIILGNPPKQSPSMENYPQADKEVRDLATELWGATPEKQHDYGKGKVFTNTSLEEIFKILNLQPDFKTSNKDDLHYTHRRSGDTDIYFVTNQSKKKIQVTPQFRVSGKQPEFWDAVMASTRPLPAYIQNEATTSVPLQLDVNQSAFIVFRPGGKPKTDALSANFPEPELITEVSTPWQVSFESDAIKRGPAETVDFPTLSDWSQSNNPQIRYYSGTAVYKTVIDGLNVDKSKGNIMLDLGKVGVMAKVKINGKYAGGAWTPPYLVDVTKFIQNGRNELEVEVVSNWANRIIGDRNLPEAERQLRLHFGPRGNDPLMESGLIGPVKITRIPGKTRSI